MSTVTENADTEVLELLRSHGRMSIAELADQTDVTQSAVRQRLTRLMGEGMVERAVHRTGRGRPSHSYALTEKARRQLGTNFDDLAMVLWQEIRQVRDPEVRRGLLARIAKALAERYAAEVDGATTAERMQSLAQLFRERRIPFSVDESAELPVLTMGECPYPALAEQDRGICAVERMLFAELLSADVRLSSCRLDGHTCCQFETN